MPGSSGTSASGPDGITLRNEATGRYLGADGDPTQVQSTMNGTDKPFAWKLSLDDTGLQPCYVLASAASGDRLVLACAATTRPPTGITMSPFAARRHRTRRVEVLRGELVRRRDLPPALLAEGF